MRRFRVPHDVLNDLIDLTYPNKKGRREIMKEYGIKHKVSKVFLMISYDLQYGCLERTERIDKFYIPYEE